MSLYLAVELCALAIPLAFSFDKKVAYYKLWTFLLPAICLNAVVFTIVDIWFTSRGVWGFNPRYHSEVVIYHLPLEEILFFIIIPYCSMFVHYVFIAYLPGRALGSKATAIISGILAMLLVVYAIIERELSYTFFYSLLTAGAIVLAFAFFPKLLSRYYITFLIIMVPFIIVNGILTGTFIDGAVFWYNPGEISGMRLLSIPVEDILFGFTLILLNLLAAESLRKLMRK